MIANLLRAIADRIDPQDGLPTSHAAYVADLTEARTEGHRDALRELSEWVAPLVREARQNAQRAEYKSANRRVWTAREAALSAVARWCRAGL